MGVGHDVYRNAPGGSSEARPEAVDDLVVPFVLLAETDQRATAQLLGTHGRHVHIEKSAFDGRCFRTRSTRLGLTVRTEQFVCVSHKG